MKVNRSALEFAHTFYIDAMLFLTGATKSKNSINLNVHKPTFSFKPKVYKEIMWGYAAAVSYLDMQLGRILDLLDRLDLWKNMTIILTSDHGMHNGEKGIW